MGCAQASDICSAIYIYIHIYIYIYSCEPHSHGRAKAERPARTYIQQFCADTGCNPEDCRNQWTIEKGGERGSRISVLVGAAWWWCDEQWREMSFDWSELQYSRKYSCGYSRECLFVYIYICVCVCVCVYVWGSSHGECGIPLHNHYSQVHSGPERWYLLGSYLWAKCNYSIIYLLFLLRVFQISRKLMVFHTGDWVRASQDSSQYSGRCQ